MKLFKIIFSRQFSEPLQCKMTFSDSFGVDLSKTTIIFEIFGRQFFSPAHESFENGCKKHKNVSRKHKFILGINLLAIGLQLSGVIFAVKLEKQMQKNSTNGITVQIIAYFYAFSVVFISVFNALIHTETCFRIFQNFKQVSSIFQRDLNHDVDYSRFSRAFNLFFTKMTLVFIASSAFTLIFIFWYNRSNIFFWACLVIFPDFSLLITFCQFIFFIRMVKENLLGTKVVLAKLLETKRMPKIQINSVQVKFASLKTSRKPVDDINDLRKVYGIL